MLPFIQRMNQIRRENPALQYLSNLTWLDTFNEQILAYAKQQGDNTVICAVNLDPHHPQEAWVVVPDHLGVPPSFQVRDLFSGEAYGWHTGSNYVRLDPWTRQAHVLHVETR
jgi:starch synthase (maltosyl-transferring)